MGSKGSFAGSHRKLKCCLMRIIRYLNQKWVPSKRRNHCTPKAELRTSRAVSTSVRWLLDSCLHVSINKIIEGGGKNHRCQILLLVSFHHLAAQRRLFRGKAWFVFTAVTHTQQQMIAQQPEHLGPEKKTSHVTVAYHLQALFAELHSGNSFVPNKPLRSRLSGHLGKARHHGVNDSCAFCRRTCDTLLAL